MSRALPLCSWCSWNWQGKNLLALVNKKFVAFFQKVVIKVKNSWNLFVAMKLQTMSVLAVMRNLRSEVDAGSIKPYCFVEVNGLKLASPENIYRVRYL